MRIHHSSTRRSSARHFKDHVRKRFTAWREAESLEQTLCRDSEPNAGLDAGFCERQLETPRYGGIGVK